MVSLVGPHVLLCPYRQLLNVSSVVPLKGQHVEHWPVLWSGVWSCCRTSGQVVQLPHVTLIIHWSELLRTPEIKAGPHECYCCRGAAGRPGGRFSSGNDLPSKRSAKMTNLRNWGNGEIKYAQDLKMKHKQIIVLKNHDKQGNNDHIIISNNKQEEPDERKIKDRE